MNLNKFNSGHTRFLTLSLVTMNISVHLPVIFALFSIKFFDVEFSPNPYVLRSPESKKLDFGNWSVCMYVCV